MIIMGFVFVILQNSASIRSEEYRLLFRLPPEEVRINSDLSGSGFVSLAFVSVLLEFDCLELWMGCRIIKILVSL